MSSRTSFPPVPSSARLPPVQENSMPQNDNGLYAARSQQPQDPLPEDTTAGDRPPWSSGYLGTWHSGGGDWGHRDRVGEGQRSAPTSHNPFEQKIPEFVEQAIVVQNGDTNENGSILVLDKTDERLIDEIMSNAASSINVLTERDQVMPPSSGYHCTLFANYTLDGVKAVLAIAISSRTGSPCAQWDSATAQAMSHPAFQPFTWPLMRDTSATYVDLKFFNGNEVLFHWVFRGYCSDSGMSVQHQFCDEALIRDARTGRFRPSVVVAVFIGWKVSVLSFEVGGRSYSVGPHGTVVAGDHCRCNCEL